MEIFDVLQDIDILGGLNCAVEFIQDNPPHVIKRKYRVKGRRIYKKKLVVNKASVYLMESLKFSLPFVRRMLEALNFLDLKQKNKNF